MAKTSTVHRDLKRRRLVQKYAAKRAEIKATLANPKTTDAEFYQAQRALNELPRDSSPVRVKNRCAISGRPRAFIRRWGVSRIQFRELALNGKIPGVMKSSW